jgi:hypothetical protein
VGALAADGAVGYSSIVRPTSHDNVRALTRLALAFLLCAGACSALRRGNGPEDETDVVTVLVINHHLLDVALYNVAQGRRDRLGEVTAAATSSFKLHLRRLPANEVQLLADPVGSSRGVTSELLRVSPGDEVRWVLESDLARSHVEIR